MTQPLLPEVASHRQADHAVDAQFLNRWSPRAFAERDIPEAELWSLFEAARWAPSASNEQPWRFLVARTPEDRERFLTFINPFNVEWCHKAPVFVVIASKTTNAKDSPNRSHAFDAGTAWGYLALEAAGRGLITHAMGGFDAEKAREVLGVPAEYELQAVIAIGYRGDAAELPERFREREVPNSRRPAAESVMEGAFRK